MNEISALLKHGDKNRLDHYYFDNGEGGDLGLQTLAGTHDARPKKNNMKREAALRFYAHDVHNMDDGNLSDFEEVPF